MKRLAIDPGEHTGLCTVVDGQIAGQHEMNWENTNVRDFHFELYNFLVQFNPDTIILERFQSRPGQVKAMLSAVEYIGVVKLYGQMSNTQVVLQTSAQVKGFWDDKKLRRVGLWVGSNHARDATRHMLAYLQRTSGVNPDNEALLMDDILHRLR